jgi:hypothetical protein
MQRALTNISTSLQKTETMSAVLEQIQHQPDAVKAIRDLEAVVRKAKCIAPPPPIDFSHYANIGKLFVPKSKVVRIRYDPYSRKCKPSPSISPEERIWKIVDKEILPKVNKDVCWEMKFNALDTLTSIRETMIWNRVGVPDAIAWAILDIGNMLSDNEIERVTAEQKLLTRVERLIVYGKTYADRERLTHFTGLFTDGSVAHDFSYCLGDIEKSLAQEPLAEQALPTSPRADQRTVPACVIRTRISIRILAKVNRRSCYETRVNALSILSKIGRQIMMASSGPYAANIKEGKVEKLLTDTMLEISQLDTETRFVDNEDLMQEIKDLNSAGGDILPGLEAVMRHLGLPEVVETENVL